MKTYKLSDLIHKREELFDNATKSGVILEQRKTNGKVINKLVLINLEEYEVMKNAVKEILKQLSAMDYQLQVERIASKAVPEAIRSERELRVKLEDLQHKYDSKVNMYRKRISQLEGKNDIR